jgi:gluconolactonase
MDAPADEPATGLATTPHGPYGSTIPQLELEEVASGLLFPEGPLALPDGSILVVEMCGGRITRIRPDAPPDSRTEVVAETGGGPNGLALGPDGAVYVCNNGGVAWGWVDGYVVAYGRAEDYTTGSIQRVDLASGEVTTLYTECDGYSLNGPNDLAFDSAGGFYFTDFGHVHERTRDRGVLYYAQPDGSDIRQATFPLFDPNGVGLSPDGRRVYVSESVTARVLWFDVESPGVFSTADDPPYHYGPGTHLLARVTGHGSQCLDSLAVDAEGNVCVGTLENPGITVVSPEGRQSFLPMPGDALTTNLCFAGPDRRTAYVTRSATGTVARTTWPVPGAPLPFGP